MHPKKRKEKKRKKERAPSNFGNCMQKRINLSICISTPNSIRKSELHLLLQAL